MEDDENVSSYQSSLYSYSEQEDSLRVYNVDLSSAFNQNYIGEESNFEGTHLIFKETTLLKIKDKAIEEIYEGEEDITAILEIISSN
jgi:hypothetical protein